jgi:hypothetical protein
MQDASEAEGKQTRPKDVRHRLAQPEVNGHRQRGNQFGEANSTSGRITHDVPI